MTEYLNSNVVFTTYHTIAASMDNKESLIFRIEWFRVVLDEGKNRQFLARHGTLTCPNQSPHDSKTRNDPFPGGDAAFSQVSVVFDRYANPKSPGGYRLSAGIPQGQPV
jgi:hypothetical protein